MNEVLSGLFKMYDIRGIYGQDLTDNVSLLIGKALGTFFLQNGQKKVFVGRDNRISGEKVFQNLTKGLLSTGCDIVNLGIIVTPLIYFSWYDQDANATVMITASHNPPEYNGFKCSLNKKPLISEDYQKVKEICLSENFTCGKGKITSLGVWESYKNKIKSTVKIAKRLKVAIDCGNGTESLFAPQLITELGCEVIPLFCESDGSFPNHQPYPQKIEFYEELRKTIKEKGCDAGIAFDGDGDRIGFYDENGNYIENDRLAMLFAQEICQQNPHPKIVMNVSTSLSVIDFIKSCGGEVILWKTGYPFISEKMQETKALFGGEISGHFFFKDKYYGFDDALYAAARMLALLSSSNLKLSQMISALPKYFETREFRVPLPENSDKFILINQIKEELKQKYPEIQIIDLDGIRFSFPDAWGLIRASNTEPLITGRAEAKSKEKLEKIKGIIEQKLREKNINFDWNNF